MAAVDLYTDEACCRGLARHRTGPTPAGDLDNGMGMSRKIPLKKIVKPREFAMPTEMVRAPVGDVPLPDAPPCPLCEEGEPIPDPSELVGIFDYETDQRDLLISFIRLTH